MTEFVALLQGYGGQLSAGGVVAVTVFLILRGTLVPKSVLDGWVTLWEGLVDTHKAESVTWREAYELERAARLKADADIAKLLELSQTTVRVLEQLPRLPPARVIDHG